MARILFVAILAMCLVAMMECSPVAPDQAATPTPDPFAKMEEIAKTLTDAAKQAVDKVANDPTLLKVVEDTKKIIADGVQTLHDQLVPKTE